MTKDFRGVKDVTSIISTFIILIILLITAAVMYYSIFYLPQFIGDKYFGILIYVAVPGPINIMTLAGVGAYVWYLILILVVSISLFLLLRKGFPKFWENVSKKSSKKMNVLQDFAEIFSITLFFVAAVTTLMRLLGINLTGMSVETAPFYSQMLSFLHASVYEEVVIRLVYVGIPVFLIHKFLKDDIKITRILGGGYTIGKIELIFIIISALIFGVAHPPLGVGGNSFQLL